MWPAIDGICLVPPTSRQTMHSTSGAGHASSRDDRGKVLGLLVSLRGARWRKRRSHRKLASSLAQRSPSSTACRVSLSPLAFQSQWSCKARQGRSGVLVRKHACRTQDANATSGRRSWPRLGDLGLLSERLRWRRVGHESRHRLGGRRKARHAASGYRQHQRHVVCLPTQAGRLIRSSSPAVGGQGVCR